MKYYIAFRYFANERVQGYRKIIVVPCDRLKPVFHGYRYIQLFEQLADKAGFRGLAFMYLPAGEFPFKRHVHGLAPLGCQDKTVSFDDGARDADVIAGGLFHCFMEVRLINKAIVYKRNASAETNGSPKLLPC
jgi:hypothetical protein